MIRTETYMLGEREFTRTWSDANRYVVREGEEYTEANDPSELGRVYAEGRVIPSDDDVPTEEQAILDILLGGDGE